MAENMDASQVDHYQEELQQSDGNGPQNQFSQNNINNYYSHEHDSNNDLDQSDQVCQNLGQGEYYSNTEQDLQ